MMRVRWSQLVYRHPGSDNAVGLARVLKSPEGEVFRFQDATDFADEAELGFLAVLPIARGMEEELDEWIEVDQEAFLDHDASLWERELTPSELQWSGLWPMLRSMFHRWQTAR